MKKDYKRAKSDHKEKLDEMSVEETGKKKTKQQMYDDIYIILK